MKGPEGSGWLSLKILEKAAGQSRGAKKALVYISIPKRVVGLVTGRNRIKRLIREATRRENWVNDTGKVYTFRVHKFPEKLNLDEVKKTITELMA